MIELQLISYAVLLFLQGETEYYLFSFVEAVNRKAFVTHWSALFSLQAVDGLQPKCAKANSMAYVDLFADSC